MLRDHGNMSAPTVLFVLERAIKRGLRGPAVLAALGPGFTASFLAINADAAWLMGQGAWLITFLIVQRLAELGYARWNTSRLLAQVASSSAARIIRCWSRCMHSGSWRCGWLGHDRNVDPLWLALSSCCKPAGYG